jgi:6,7-dimethyl-8-ribityllumazine synthase
MSKANTVVVDESKYRIALVVSEFNQAITTPLLEGAIEQFHKLGVTKEQLTIHFVPGAVEIPLVTKLLAKKACFDAIVTLGAVIRGETSHYDYVCQQVSQGCQQVMLESELPVVFGLLTTENQAQAKDRIGGAHGHKGKEAADCAIDMIKLVQSI